MITGKTEKYGNSARSLLRYRYRYYRRKAVLTSKGFSKQYTNEQNLKAERRKLPGLEVAKNMASVSHKNLSEINDTVDAVSSFAANYILAYQYLQQGKARRAGRSYDKYALSQVKREIKDKLKKIFPRE